MRGNRPRRRGLGSFPDMRGERAGTRLCYCPLNPELLTLAIELRNFEDQEDATQIDF